MSTLFDRLKAALAERYHVEREIGRGGMAIVYLATDRQHGRPVAIKVVKPEVVASVGPERFLREIETAARLNHPHILPVHDSGEFENFLYYVMPYVEGESLRARLREEPLLPIDLAVRIGSEVADGLEYAHSRGIVHRDIKPENILFQGRHVVIADFGLARAIEDTERHRLTESGLAVGTPSYMAPEQASGDKVDGRTDIYALGCVLYETLVGEPPLIGPTAQATIGRRLVETPLSPCKIRDTIPPKLGEAVSRCLAKLPADRFASAGDLRRALRAAVEISTSSDQELRTIAVPGEAERRPLLRRLRPYLITLALAGLAAFAAVYFIVPALTPTLAPDRVLVAGFENRTANPGLEHVGGMAADWIIQGIQQTNAVEVVPTPTALQVSEYVRSEREAGRVRDPVRALAREAGAGIVVSGAFYRERDSLEFLAQVTDARHRRLLTSLGPERAAEGALGPALARLRERLMGFLAAHFDQRALVAPGLANQPPTFEAYRSFGDGMDHYLRNQPALAAPLFHRAFEQDTTFVVPLLYAALSHSNLQEWAEADSLLHFVAERSGQLSDYHRAWLEYRRAWIAGEREQALGAIRRVAALAPGSKAVYNLAVMAWETNRPQEAIRALEGLDPARGAMRGWFAYWVVLANSHHLLGEHQQELIVARRGRAMYPYELRGLVVELRALAAQGLTAELEALLAEAQEFPSPATHQLPGPLLRRAGEELDAHGYPEAARDMYARAVRWFEERPRGSEAAGAEGASAEGASARAAGPDWEHALTLYRAERWREAQAMFAALAEQNPDRIDYLGYRGLAAARLGEPAARTIFNSLLTWNRPYTFGLDSYYASAIAAQLGELERSLMLLRQAFSEGLPPVWIHETGADRDFAALEDMDEFQELMRPEG